MAGVRNSMFLFFVSAFLFITQGIVSIGFDDGMGAFVSFTFAFVMFVGGAFAGIGRLMAITERTHSEYWGNTRVDHYRDTGNRVQCTPCWGVCWGIIAIIIAFLFAEPLFSTMGDSAIMVIVPAILGGIFAIFAAVVFVLQYKGPYSATAQEVGY